MLGKHASERDHPLHLRSHDAGGSLPVGRWLSGYRDLPSRQLSPMPSRLPDRPMCLRVFRRRPDRHALGPGLARLVIRKNPRIDKSAAAQPPKPMSPACLPHRVAVRHTSQAASLAPAVDRPRRRAEPPGRPVEAARRHAGRAGTSARCPGHNPSSRDRCCLVPRGSRPCRLRWSQ